MRRGRIRPHGARSCRTSRFSPSSSQTRRCPSTNGGSMSLPGAYLELSNGATDWKKRPVRGTEVSKKSRRYCFGRGLYIRECGPEGIHVMPRWDQYIDPWRIGMESRSWAASVSSVPTEGKHAI